MGESAEITVRPATQDDVAAICESLAPFTAKKLILARNPDELKERIGNFLVAVDGQGQLIGTVALRDFGDGLMEIRTLTVSESLHGQRLGTRLVQTAVDTAYERNATRVFTLTMRPNLFMRLGFRVVDITVFPQKVKFDCQACPKRQQCDEIALLLELQAFQST